MGMKCEDKVALREILVYNVKTLKRNILKYLVQNIFITIFVTHTMERTESLSLMEWMQRFHCDTAECT